jgi:hypothetical protein
LRASIKLNPAFGPSYDRLAAFLAMRHRDLDEARMMALNAVQLEPGNLNYRLDTANVLLAMERGKDAVTVIRNAMHLAKSPEEVASVQSFLQHSEEYASAQETMREHNQQFSERMKAQKVAQVTGAGVEATEAASASPDEPLPRGPHRFMVGVVKNVRCDPPAMDLDVVAAGKTVGVHASNYYKVQFTALKVIPKGDLHPCTDLEGKPAKVEFVGSPGKSGVPQLIGVEIH